MNKTVDILYLAKDRIEFTKQTFSMLLQNTNWDLVNKLVVYDDGSPKDDRNWLKKATMELEMKNEFRATNFGSPVAVMLHFLDRREANVFAKIDNDIVVPPGWLEAMTSVMEKRPTLDLLGMEAGRSRPPKDNWRGSYGINKDCSHIGGVGLIKGSSIRRHSRPVPNGRFGWTENQHENNYERAWIKPDLQLHALDQLPLEPWMSLSRSYIDAGVQRKWGIYPREMTWYWEWAGYNK
jgi:hypothetical protein